MALNASAVMDGIGVRLQTITGLRVFDFPPDSLQPPAAIVSYPEISYDSTLGRGVDRMTVPVYVYVGRVSDRASRDALTAYMAGTGAQSIKTAVEGDKTLGGAAQSVRVMSATPVDGSEVAGQPFVAVRFDIDVVG
ncbi:MAG: hypothetical protein AB1679_14320 [Actinomycetota bacterium]|jgi:hypothetical protein